MVITNRKIMAMLVLMAGVAGWSFAQADDFETEEQQTTSVAKPQDTMPMNTITVDFGPTIIGGMFKAAGSFMGEEGLSSSGFGIGAQYERQILEKFTVAGRFAYLGVGIGMKQGQNPGGGIDVNTSLNMNLSSFSLEAHARYYPWAKTFFLDGMLGYANMSMKFSGKINVSYEGSEHTEPISLAVLRSYFKLGAKIGWRIDFGRPGGFVFEPSFGLYGGLGLGDTMGKRLESEIRSQFGVTSDISDIKTFDDLFGLIENFMFVGGPRVCLSFGWRF